ncbi:hypothetical protein PYW07_003782 [Mythimna separata]|uniref:C-type lectin domain-containing protein n=1 Tax=Mythimna separata TaxID=271217 RepID=A0AAD7YMU3_MYTSE|nr:hypothetical protein PYW07_003782 [Mythimna separata]
MFSKAVLLFLVVYFSLGCANGLKTEKFFREDYTYIEAVESFYKIHTTPRKWAEAKRTCALEGATLWHPDNDDEAREVKTFWKNTQPSIEWVYVGLSDIMAEGVFETVDGEPVSKVYNKWEPGQPNDKNGREDCVYLYKDYNLDDWPCDYDYHFICKKSLYSLESDSNCNSSVSDGQDANTLYRKDYRYMENEESYYKIHTSPKTWAKAKQTCELEDATLWHPDNNAEAQAVISYWKTTQPHIRWVYVGLTDEETEGVFKTLDGKSVSQVYNKWEPGQPGNNGDCAYLYKEGNLGDWTCDSAYYFICKKTLSSLEWYYHCNASDLDRPPKKFFRNDYNYIKAEDSFYKIHTTPQTWPDAKRVCALEGATFWHPDNEDEANAVISFWNSTQPHIGWVYVGVSEIMADGMFETVDGKAISEVYNKWQPGQPDNFGGNQHCVYIYRDREGVLDNWPCDYKYNFICKKSFQSLEWNHHCGMPDSDYIFNKNNRKCYKVHTTPLNWTEAYTTCRREQSHLAVVTNKHEVDYLVNLTESTPTPRVKNDFEKGVYHLGFHNRFNEGWQTVKGTPMSVDAENWWDSNKPAEDRDQCGSMFYTGRLINTDCDMKSFFICEHERS